MGFSVVIIDHEPLMAARLKKCLLTVAPDMTVAAICYEGELAAACLAEYKPDLVFLTIEMPRLSVLPLPRRFSGRWAQTGSRLCDRGTRFRVPYAEADGPGLFSQARDRRGSAQAVRSSRPCT